MTLRLIFAANLRTARETSGHSHESLAEASGIAVHILLAYEQAEEQADLDHLEALARTLQVKPADLVRKR